MFKILTLSALAVLGLASHHHHEEVSSYEAWPPLARLTTFKADATLHTWDGANLKPF